MKYFSKINSKVLTIAISSLMFVVISVNIAVPNIGATAIPTPATSIIYGDSIMYESRQVVTNKFSTKKGWTNYIRSYPGYAICDWQSSLVSDLATYHPKVVTLEMQGNSVTDCMKDANGAQIVSGSAAWAAKYRWDLNLFFATATSSGAKVVFLKSLPRGYPDSSPATLNSIALQEAGKFHGVSISGVPLNSVTASGKFTVTKACLAIEKTSVSYGCNLVTNKIVVRYKDGLHLCPTSYVNDDIVQGCTTYSSGAYRFGLATFNTTINPPLPVLP